MSRCGVPVSADWVEESLNTLGIVLAEADEDTSACDGGHITGAARLDWKTGRQDSVIRDVVNK